MLNPISYSSFYLVNLLEILIMALSCLRHVYACENFLYDMLTGLLMGFIIIL